MSDTAPAELDDRWSQMLQAARQARLRARAPFSGFQVGAAVLTPAGAIHTGCNIENASYGLTVCAERVALWKAISEGHDQFTRLVVVADTPKLTPPCGACRQLIWEFCGEIPILLANLQTTREIISSRELLPRAFDAGFL
jgi:cytidine deaminase